jgi:predicted acyltransferase
MMLVNNPGDGRTTFAPLLHADWHGWTFTDLVFPFFLWMVGIAMTFSYARRVEEGDRPGGGDRPTSDRVLRLGRITARNQRQKGNGDKEVIWFQRRKVLT